MAHGAAAFPGASRVGAALTLLLWLGLRPGRALDLALLMTIPSLLATFARAAFGPSPSGAPLGVISLGLVIAFVSTAIGVAVLRSLAARRRVGVLALWIIPLGLATIAYARALPSAALEVPGERRSLAYDADEAERVWGVI
jgi:undecaprenyl-diphosphatase